MMFLIFCIVAFISMCVWTGLNALVSGECKAEEILKGVLSGLVQAAVILFASSAHPWLALVLLVAVAALIVFYVCWSFQISRYRFRQIAGFALIHLFLLLTMWATIEAIRDAVGPTTVVGGTMLLFGRITAIAAVALTVARISATFGSSALVKAVLVFAVVLTIAAVVATIYGGISNLDFHPFKGGKSAIGAVDESDESEGNFILRWLKGLSKGKDVSSVVDDESVATEAAEESVATEAAEESVAAEVAEESDEVEVGREPIVVENAWFDFYNLSIQEDGKGENDFDFGPKPAGETASEIAKEHRERLRIDPALGAADIAWADALLGTRYLGEFYESCKHDWAKTINAAKERFMEDHEAYDEVLDAFMKMQAKAKVYMQDGEIMEDQMYMNPYTIDGYPDVIVLKTPNHKGKFLVYEYTIKGTGVVKVAYRIDCGFQPTDVQKVMNITPATEAPEKKPDTPKPPTSGEITPVPKAPTPTPSPKPTPTTPGEGGDPPAKKVPKEDAVNHDGGASTGGGDNTSDGGVDEYQQEDPRQEEIVAPAEVEPETPPVVEAYREEPVVSYEEPVNYAPDPVTDRGAADGATAPTSEGGDGEFVPED